MHTVRRRLRLFPILALLGLTLLNTNGNSQNRTTALPQPADERPINTETAAPHPNPAPSLPRTPAAPLGPTPAWVPLGPAPIPNGQTQGRTDPVSGRVTAIVVHPTTPNTVYVGTAQGGVYRSLDGG